MKFLLEDSKLIAEYLVIHKLTECNAEDYLEINTHTQLSFQNYNYLMKSIEK